ncbi:MAG: 4a-hydroxytetrahydrobiopterin dehydratase [Cytophagales bacterium]|nr:4a-hydroxytetrahydrobiopterin dehydratase [Armatimonadota bacterium]
MTTTAKLSEAAVEEKLANTTGWSLQNSALTKTFVFADFVQSLQFVNRLAIAAEAAQHHPDMDIRYAKVTVTLTTHDSGGITEKDFALAQEADAVAERG